MGKRIIAFVIVILLTVGGAGNVAADAAAPSSVGSGGASSSTSDMSADPGNAIDVKNLKVSKQEAKQISLELLKKYFGLEIDEKKYQGTVQLTPDYEADKGYTWQLSWRLSSSNMYTNLRTEIDASTGRLLSFYRSESYNSQEQIEVASITKEQARKQAEEFIEKINPEEFKQVKLDDSRDVIYSGSIRPRYSFSYIREINGLRYPGNFISVGVNGANGNIVSYNSRWEYDTSFPAAEGLLEKEKALAILKDRTNMVLCYIPMRNTATRYMAPNEVRLVYSPDSSRGRLIDARTGDPTDYNGEKTDSQKKRDISQEQKNKLMAGKPKIFGGTSEMNSEEAEAFITGLAKEFFGAGYKAGNLSYSENEMAWSGENRRTWGAEVLEDKPEAIEGKGHISIDSSTGEVLNIGRYVFENWYGKEYERRLTWEQAYDKAVELLGQYFPHKLGDIRTEQVYHENLYPVNGKMIPDRMINFNFPRLVNGIRYGNDSINISIDTKTGEVNDLYYSWSTTISFPSTEGIIDKKKAKEIYFKEYDALLTYFQYNKKINENEYKKDLKIVYTLEQKQRRSSSGNIDAYTGKFLNYDGQEIVTEKDSFSELIKGNPAEKELSILAFQGIIDTKNFKPDRDTTYMELIRMLVNAKGYRPYMTRNPEELLFKNVDKKDENYTYLLEAVRYGIIENRPIELKLDESVTREQMAELIVKLLKYEKLARVGDIFVLDFKDSDMISSELKGHVAIAKGLGIIDGSPEMFKPKENIKMHEAALAIYKALESMREAN